jgi:hypothetical protein
VNEIYETFESDINTIFDKHVPIKEMYRKNNQLPYMNRELRKAIYNKKIWFSRTQFVYSHRCIFLGNNYFQIFFLTYLLNFFLICTVPSF